MFCLVFWTKNFNGRFYWVTFSRVTCNKSWSKPRGDLEDVVEGGITFRWCEVWCQKYQISFFFSCFVFSKCSKDEHLSIYHSQGQTVQNVYLIELTETWVLETLSKNIFNCIDRKQLILLGFVSLVGTNCNVSYLLLHFRPFHLLFLLFPGSPAIQAGFHHITFYWTLLTWMSVAWRPG